MDTALTDLSKVVDFSSNQLNEMADASINLGKELGKSSVEIMQGMSEFGRITKDQNEIIELSRVATMASNVTTMTSAEAAKAITTSMITFGIEAKDSMRILNSLNEVQNNFKVSAEDMVASISKIGAASRLANTDMEDLEGMTAAIVQSLGISGNEAGTAIKSFMSRIYRTDESNPDELGKTAKALKEIMDIDTSDANGNLKSFNDLISEIKSGWSEMSKQEQLAVAQSMGSTYHYSKFIALLENYQIKLDAAAKARNSENSALDENAKKLDSLSGRLGLLKVAGEEFSASIINSNALKEMVSSATSLVGIFTKITSTIGGIPTILATAVIALSLFKKQWTALSFTNVGVSGASIGVGSGIFSELTKNLINFKTRYASVMAENIRINNSLSASLAGVRASTNTVQVGYAALTGRTIAQTIATVGATVATVAFNAALTVGLSLLIMGAVKAFSNLTQKSEEQKQAFDDLTQSIAVLKKETSELPSLISSYEELFDKLGKTTEEKEELANATARLSSLFGDSVIQLDSEGKAIQVDIEYVKQLTQAKKDLLTTQQNELGSKFNSMGKDQYDEILEKQNRIKEINAEIAENDKKVASLENASDPITGYINENGILGIKGIKDYQDSIAELASERTKLSGESSEIQKTLSQEAHAFDQSSDSANKLSQSLINNLAKATFDSEKGFDELKDTMEVFKNPEISEAFKRISEDMTKGASIEKATKDIHDMSYALIKNNVDLDIASALLKIFNNAIKLDNAPETITNLKDMTVSSEDLADSLKDVTSVATDVSKAMEEYNETGKLSASTIVDLVTKYPELIDQLKVENGQLTLNKEAVQGLLDVRINGMITALEAEKTFTSNQAEQTKVRISNLIAEAEAIRQRNNVLNALPTFLQTPTIKSSTGTVFLNEEEEKLRMANALQSQLNADNGVDDKISAMKALLGNIKSAANSGSYNPYKKEKEDKPQDPSYTDPIDSIIRQINSQSQLTSSKNKSLSTELSQIKSNKEYALQLSKTNSLISSQKTEIDELNQANSTLKSKMDEIKHIGFGAVNWLDNSGELTTTYYDQYNSASKETQENMQKEADQLSKLTKSMRDNEKSINELNSSQIELNSTILDINYSIATQSLESYNKSIESISDSLSLLKSEQSQYDQQSIQYSDNQKQQIELLKQKSEAIQSEIDHLQILIATTQLTADAQEELQSTLTSLYSSLSSTKSETLSIYNSIADGIINTFKRAYEKQKDIAIAEIEDEMDYEDKRHEKKLDNLDKEMQRYQDAYDEKMKLINDEANAEDYNLNLTNAQKDAQKIQNDINILSLDDSIEAKFKREELETQLADKITEIEKMQKDHSRDLRKDALSEQLDDYKTDIDAKKDSEESKYKSIKDSLDKQKTDTEYMYNELINDERKYASMRLAIISGNTNAIKSQMSSFLSDFKDMNKSTARSLGESWNDLLDLIDEVKSASKSVDKLKDSKSDSSSKSSKINVYGNSIDIGLAKDVNNADKFNFITVNNGDASSAKSGDIVLGGSAVIPNIGQGERIWGDDRYKTLEKFKKKTEGFKTGGVNNVPGMTMLHGTNSSVETIFNATDGKKLWDIVHNLPSLSTNLMSNFKPLDYSNILKQSQQQTMEFKFDNLIHVEGNVDAKSLPSLEKIAKYTINELNKTFNRNGIFRK